MTYTYQNKGVCSRQTNVELAEDHTIQNIEVIGGCNGNLKAIGRLVEGQEASKVSEILRGNTCGPRPTSCADQLSKAIDQALAEKIA